MRQLSPSEFVFLVTSAAVDTARIFRTQEPNLLFVSRLYSVCHL